MQTRERIIGTTDFKKVMSRFATGVTVVSVSLRGEPHGMTVSSFCSVSLDPMLILVCLDKDAVTTSIITQTGKFAVNILSLEQESVARIFAGKENENSKFSDIDYFISENGLPILGRTLGYLECTLRYTYDGGDHTIFVGEITDLALVSPDAAPLLYFRSDYKSLTR